MNNDKGGMNSMTFSITAPMRAYLKGKNSTTITIPIVKKRGNCCAIGVPAPYLGAPKKHPERFDCHQYEDYTIYIDQRAVASDDHITIDYSRMLLLEMIEVHGLDINRML